MEKGAELYATTADGVMVNIEDSNGETFEIVNNNQ